MNEEVRLHLERADDCIKDAELLLSAYRQSAAAGRAYYAMFHAATAVLLKRNIRRHSHKGIISAFGQFFVKSGDVEMRFHKYIAEAFDLRQESDYEPLVDITERQVKRVLEWAKEFVEVCRNLCE
ncbi:MAG: HEPN domain-containing protein [Sedimentisphaerales bacterium]|nr:HEPN domain-containing protein [Sedimentisphaerales bacterium]